MTPARIHRRHAHVVSFQSNPDGRLHAFAVKCPFCRGLHQHAAWRTTDYAQPHCGAFTGYEVVWPDPVSPASIASSYNLAPLPEEIIE